MSGVTDLRATRESRPAPTEKAEAEALLQVVFGQPTIDAIKLLVNEQVEARLAARERPRWMTVAQTATFLGLSEKAVRRRIERGEIAVTRQGRRVLVDGLALDRELRGATDD